MSGIENTEWAKRAERRAKADPYGVYDGCHTWMLDEIIKKKRRKRNYDRKDL